MVIIDTVVNTLFGGLTLDPAGMHCPSWDDAFVSSCPLLLLLEAGSPKEEPLAIADADANIFYSLVYLDTVLVANQQYQSTDLCYFLLEGFVLNYSVGKSIDPIYMLTCACIIHICIIHICITCTFYAF